MLLHWGVLPPKTGVAPGKRTGNWQDTSVTGGTFRCILWGGCSILGRKAPGLGSLYKGKGLIQVLPQAVPTCQPLTSLPGAALPVRAFSEVESCSRSLPTSSGCTCSYKVLPNHSDWGWFSTGVTESDT